MKRIFLFITALLFGNLLFANHITGGEMYYTLVKQSGNDYTYHVVLKLYRDCFAPANAAQLDPDAAIAIFRNGSNNMVWNQNVNMTFKESLNLGSPSECILAPPKVCYEVGHYEFDVTLPGVAEGYTIAYQRCCRIADINNLQISNSVGATYTAQIPGTAILANGPANNSARFSGKDTVIVCAGNNFCYDFSATDPDKTTLGDSLAYSFCSAYVGGGQSGNPAGGPNSPAPNPPAAPPYSSVPYSYPYSSLWPLGDQVTLDPLTGVMCGIAPPPGIYVVTVCVTEYRQGKPIATQRKDLQIKVGDCNIADAALRPEYITCDGLTYTFKNEAPASSLIKTYTWEFSDGTVSNDASPVHTFADSGIYDFKIVINRGEECSDSAVSKIKVYPGFFPGFRTVGICNNKPTQFLDTTKTKYGLVDSWKWDFGDPGSTTDVSTLQNPTYVYPQTGPKNIRFIVSNSKGCIDTVFKTIDILDKPPLSVAFKDTLICSADDLRLHAVGDGNFSWTPGYNIQQSNTPDPLVSPDVTTKYVVKLDYQGCINFDTVQVRVVDFVTLNAMGDTIICATDSVQLGASGDALRYAWSPPENISNPDMANPKAKTTVTTTYQVAGYIGSCVSTDRMKVTAVPYPGANAGQDTVVCFETPAQLQGTIAGSSFTWSPTASLTNANTLNPLARPKKTTSYVLTVMDNIGCPKPGRDTVLVSVLPEIMAFAGNDTAVVVNEPLQLNGSGGTGYVWSPATSLSSTTIANPVGFYNGSFDSIQYKLLVGNEYGCVDSAFITVRIFKTAPQIFVPTAFTPNADGKNDVFRPIAVGISKIDYFRVFNRWGQLVFSTTTNGRGWDGKIGGKEQGTGTFVWVVRGVDFTGKVVFSKGTVTLIR
jgi:gliding motility-associated-like protein